jgi:hypothetical protein
LESKAPTRVCLELQNFVIGILKAQSLETFRGKIRLKIKRINLNEKNRIKN